MKQLEGNCSFKFIHSIVSIFKSNFQNKLSEAHNSFFKFRLFNIPSFSLILYNILSTAFIAAAAHCSSSSAVAPLTPIAPSKTEKAKPGIIPGFPSLP